MPIGLDKNSNKDWNSFDNYFYFPDLDEPFYSLEKGMNRYKELVSFPQRYGEDIDPRLFPISEFEDSIHAVIGCEEQEETSPVFWLNADCLQANIEYIEWPSLTNMMLAWAEIIERNLNRYAPTDMKEIIAIRRKFGWVR